MAQASPSWRGGLIDRLRRQAGDVLRLTDGLTDDLLERRSVPAQWSLAELTWHLLRVQNLFESRLDAMLQRETPEFESYAPEGDAGFAEMVASERGTEAVQRFVAAREGFAARLETLAPEAWLRTGLHPTFGRFDVAFLIEYLAHHEAHHLYQMFQRRIPLLRGRT